MYMPLQVRLLSTSGVRHFILHLGLPLEMSTTQSHTRNKQPRKHLMEAFVVLIIHEISMVKADLLYQLDSRLREFTGRHNQLFGGVAPFFFGDIMQLQPVMANYIWLQLRSQECHQAYQVEPHWE